ncbi:MAG: hypothetical protein ACFHWZ_18575 [Phycisphaerales bacterium]
MRARSAIPAAALSLDLLLDDLLLHTPLFPGRVRFAEEVPIAIIVIVIVIVIVGDALAFVGDGVEVEVGAARGFGLDGRPVVAVELADEHRVVLGEASTVVNDLALFVEDVVELGGLGLRGREQRGVELFSVDAGDVVAGFGDLADVALEHAAALALALHALASAEVGAELAPQSCSASFISLRISS